MKKKYAFLAVLLSAALTASQAMPVFAASITQDSSKQTYSSAASDENAVLVDGKTVTLTSPTVTKSGGSSKSDADFYGTNAAVLAKNKATLTIKGGTVTTSGAYANGIFSYGSGTTVNVSGTTIRTTANNSGGIMTTGGATMNAEDLTITTEGGSSAAIRSDRGGGDVNVTGGTYTTSGTGSPVIYSTADIDVENAVLTSNTSEAVVIEGGNSVSLKNCTVSADNTKLNGQASNYDNVLIYQSMSGDASEGSSEFDLTGGTMTCKNGYLFCITNTTTNIFLSGASLTTAGGKLLIADAEKWGTSGSNGGNVTLTAKDNQQLSGSMTVDSSSTLNLILSGGSDYTGAVNSAADAGKVYAEIPAGCTWTLSADSHITSLTCDASAINLNGHTLYVNGTAYTSGTASTGSKVSGSSSSSTPSDSNTPSDKPSDSNTPSDKPSDSNTPPDKPSGSDTPSDKPSDTDTDDSSSDTHERIGGLNRYETSEQIAEKAFPDGTDCAVLVSGANFPDALSASALAGLLNGPVLLTEKDRLNDYTKKALTDLGVKKAVIIGSTDSMTQTVADALSSLDIRTARISGTNRYETAYAVFKDGASCASSLTGETKSWSGDVILTCGGQFADALSISPYAYASATPVLLANADGTLSDEVKAAAVSASDVIIVGSDRSVCKEADSLNKNTVRLSGNNRYETSRAIAEWLTGSSDASVQPKVVFSKSNTAIASGAGYADALSGAALQGKSKAPLLLVNGSSAASAGKFIGDADVRILGSEKSVSADVVKKLS